MRPSQFFARPLERIAYVKAVLGIFLAQHVVNDVLLVTSPQAFKYDAVRRSLVSVLLGPFAAIAFLAQAPHAAAAAGMLATALLAVVAVIVALRRAATIGWPPATAVFAVAPIAGLVAFALAATWDERVADHAASPPAHVFRWAFAASVVAALTGAIVAGVGPQLFSDLYGWGIFASLPFLQGLFAVVAAGRRRPLSLGESVRIGALTLGLTGAMLLVFAFEGFLCVLMALPIVTVFGIAGAALGYVLQRPGGRGRPSAAMPALLLLVTPGMMAIDRYDAAAAPLYAVRSSVEVDAPPAVVWRRVIAFPPLAPPTEPIFRAGVAYPKRAHIVGRGLGAVRYCEFSTGAFVEPVTAWIPDRVLAFRVAANPEPLQEWTPYGAIDTAHLHGYMQSERGRFDLVPLPNGRTRLVGTTWYRHHLWPAAYWRLWSDGIVHTIHLRVLRHVARLAEADVAIRKPVRSDRLRAEIARRIR